MNWLSRTLTLAALVAAPALHAQVECTFDVDAIAELPPIDRGLSELVPTIPSFHCEGGEPGETVLVQVNLFFNAPLANPVIGPEEGLTNAVILVGDPARGSEVLNANVFQFFESPQNENELATFVRYDVPADGGPITLRPLGVRVDSSSFAAGERLGVAPFFDGVPPGAPFDLAQATGELPATLEILSAEEAGLGPEYAGAVRITENRPGAIRPRQVFDFPGIDYTDPAVWAQSQSQTILRDATGAPDLRFAADSGNRFQLEFRDLPPGVTALTHPIFSDARVRQAIAMHVVTDSIEQLLGGTSLAGMPPDAIVESEPAPYSPEAAHQLLLEAGWAPGADGIRRFEPATFVVPFGWNCSDVVGLESMQLTLSARYAPWPEGSAPLSEEKQGGFGGAIPLPGPAFDPNLGPADGITFDPADCNRLAQPSPMVSEGGAVNGASFEGPAAPGSIVSLFGTGLGPTAPQSADSIPLPNELGGVEVEVDGVMAPLLFVSEPQINFQIPQELAPSRRLTVQGAPQTPMATVVVRRNGLASDPLDIPLAVANPGIFTLDSGLGRAIAINPDGSLAQPVGSIPGLSARPVAVGEALVILATGLGATTPAGVTGDDSLDENGAFVRRDTILTPRVLIGGVEAQLLFSGLSPQFVGVYQLNVIPAAGTPAGDAESLVIEMNGMASRADVTIAVAAP